MLAGVIGWPVSHSRSPRLHGYWLRHYGITGHYVPLAVRPQDFGAAVAMLPRLGFVGANVTLPHKEAAFAVCDDVEPMAQRIGAVNTLIFQDGRVVGRNTDGYGFLANLRAGAPTWQPTAGPAVLLGAGGGARAAAVALLDAGVPSVTLVNRTRARAEAVVDALGGGLAAADWSDLPALLADATLLVNTTSLGMTGQPPLEVDLTGLSPKALVTDIVYAPLETQLLASARARGNPTVDGLGMLLHQAVPGFTAWFGIAPEVTPALRAAVLG